jgi:hypothetical protein
MPFLAGAYCFTLKWLMARDIICLRTPIAPIQPERHG